MVLGLGLEAKSVIEIKLCDRMKRPFIIGDKIYLRALEKEDVELMAKWFNDSEVRHFFPANKPTTIEHWENWFEKEEKNENSIYLGIAKQEDDKLIGYTNFSDINWSHRITKEFGIIIGEKDEWNKGYGEEASKLPARKRTGVIPS